MRITDWSSDVCPPDLGANHVRCFLGDSAGGDAGAGSIKAIAFRALESPLGPALLQTAGLPLHVAGRLQIDRWNGREGVQFIIEDDAPAAGYGRSGGRRVGNRGASVRENGGVAAT